MQDVGQNGPESEVNPLVDNGFLYTTDGWGTLYKIDGKNPNKGEFVWVTDPGVKHQGNKSLSRGIALWEDLVIANLPDGRVIGVKRETGEIVWDKMVAKTIEFGGKERFNTAPITADGKVIVANGAGDAKTRGWIAGLDARTGDELWLGRARAFAMHALEQVERAIALDARGRHTLWTGDPGTALFLASCIDAQPGFPTIDRW